MGVPAPRQGGPGRLCLRALSSSEYNLAAHDDLVMVADVMTESMHTIPPEMDRFAIAHEFVTLRVRRLPVVVENRSWIR